MVVSLGRQNLLLSTFMVGRILRVSLTPAGMKFVGRVFPKHAKVVKALMRALEAREQLSLCRICQKLRKGDAAKFYNEMCLQDEPLDLGSEE